MLCSLGFGDSGSSPHRSRLTTSSTTVALQDIPQRGDFAFGQGRNHLLIDDVHDFISFVENVFPGGSQQVEPAPSVIWVSFPRDKA